MAARQAAPGLLPEGAVGMLAGVSGFAFQGTNAHCIVGSATAPVAAMAMAAAAPGMDQASQWWNAMQQQFGQMMTAAQAGTASMMATPAPTTKKSKAENEKGA